MSKSYDKYLQSDHWKKIAEETKRLAGYRCQVCNSDENLQTHHRTYERKGDEFQSDLTCLCANCHIIFHEKENSDPIVNKDIEYELHLRNCEDGKYVNVTPVKFRKWNEFVDFICNLKEGSYESDTFMFFGDTDENKIVVSIDIDDIKRAYLKYVNDGSLIFQFSSSHKYENRYIGVDSLINAIGRPNHHLGIELYHGELKKLILPVLPGSAQY